MLYYKLYVLFIPTNKTQMKNTHKISAILDMHISEYMVDFCIVLAYKHERESTLIETQLKNA